MEQEKENVPFKSTTYFSFRGVNISGVCGVWQPSVIKNLHSVGQRPNMRLLNARQTKIVLKNIFKLLQVEAESSVFSVFLVAHTLYHLGKL